MKGKPDGKKKKILTTGIALTLICAMLTQITNSFSVSAKKKVTLSGACGESATWQYDKRTKTMTVCGTGVVTAGAWWNEEWFDDSYDYPGENDNLIETLIIEDGITAIGKDAFDGGYMSVVKTLTEIGSSAFSECIGIKELKIPRMLRK